MSLLEDVRFDLRTLAKNAGFAAVAITALALGIGVNATVFSLANAVLFKNLPFAGSDRVFYARSRDVLSLIFSQGMTHVAIGLAMGLAAALAVMKVLTSLLIDVSAPCASIRSTHCATNRK